MADRRARRAARCSATIARPATAATRKGGKGFPNLTTTSWLWGGDPETIAETIRVGINSTIPRRRTSADDGLRPRPDPAACRHRQCRGLCAVLVGPQAAADGGTVAAGKAVFAANCVACHGDDGKGKTDLGAPNLTDPVLDLWRRHASRSTRPSGRPAGAHAVLGGPPVAARPQDPRALRARSEVHATP